MPIANCVLSPKLQHPNDSASDIIEIWGKHAGKDTSEMTVNFIRSEQQVGQQYQVICTLLLPTLWSSVAVKSLQSGLSSAIADYFSIAKNEVIVTTSLIDPTLIVDG